VTPQPQRPNACNVGGQAVIEGVMMRSPRSFAVVCRRPGGSLVVREQRWRSLSERFRPLRWPFLRGSAVLIESLWNGMTALNFSAQQQELADPRASQEEDKREAGFAGVFVISILFALLIFKAVPHLLTWLLGLSTASISFHLVDGGFKVLLLVGYIGGIGLMKDVRRVFQYHGAEHKAIWAHEKGLPLEVENVRAQTRFHPRCGTSFLVMVILISIFLFALLLRYPISEVSIVDNLVKILIKVPLMLPIAGLSYEGIKLSGKFREHLLVKLLVTPGLWLQRLTTREPSDDQLEVSILSLKKTLWREGITERTPEAVAPTADAPIEQVFESYQAALASLEPGGAAAAT
jgi:uncharacterized protein YqhQ